MPLNEAEAGGMTVNERLVAVGELDAFEAAVDRGDVLEMRRLLAAVFVDEASVAAIVAAVSDPDWAVRVETARRFPPGDWQQATHALQQLALPFLGVPERDLDRARIRMALVKLARGDLAALLRWAEQAESDWRDVLVEAGLAEADWKAVLAREGFAVPGGGGGDESPRTHPTPSPNPSWLPGGPTTGSPPISSSISLTRCGTSPFPERRGAPSARSPDTSTTRGACG